MFTAKSGTRDVIAEHVRLLWYNHKGEGFRLFLNTCIWSSASVNEPNPDPGVFLNANPDPAAFKMRVQL